MSRHRLLGLLGALFVGLAGLFPVGARADHLGQYEVADGMTVYLGLMAAEVLRQHPQRYPAQMRAKIPRAANTYHVLLALFDNASGERITDAEVEARVSPVGLVGTTRRLDPMVVAGALTYCNYFKIKPTDTYLVEARIRRPGASRVVEVRFVLEPHRY